MMKKSPARSLSKGLSKAGLGMRKSTAAARTMSKPSQRTPKETLQSVNNLNAYNQAAQRQAQAVARQQQKAPTQKPVGARQQQPQITRSKGPGGLTRITPSLAQQQAQYDKNMTQASNLPPAQRALFSKKFQEAVQRGDPSTIRPGSKPPPTLKQIAKASKDMRAGALTKKRKI